MNYDSASSATSRGGDKPQQPMQDGSRKNSSASISSSISRQSSSRSYSRASGGSSFDSLSPDPMISGNSEAPNIPARNRIRRSETSPPVISLEDSIQESNGNMAAGVEHGGAGLSVDRLAPAISSPCLATSAPTPTTFSTTGGGGSGNRSDGSSSSVGNNSIVLPSSSFGANTSSSTAPTWSTAGLAASVTSSLAAFEANGGANPSSPAVVSAPASSSSPLNGSCNASIDEPLILATGTPPSPILGQRPARSRSPASYSPPGRQAPDGAGSSTTQTSSREASLEKTSSIAVVGNAGSSGGMLLSAGNATAEGSLDQISMEGAESGSAGSMRSFEHHPRSATSGQESVNGTKRSTGKRKSAWYQMLNPTYRSRYEDFKRIFKDLPPDERLIVDYSCALQRDILLQGRIYVTQNYLCFYANIFRWETLVQLRWKDVSSLTKEKTALVIPNAIQICTEAEKHFFCSFGARDKTYVVLFRTWQQALLDQPLGNQDLWKFVHSVYGPELGYSSNDEGPSSLCVVDGPVVALVGDASPVSDLGQLIPPPVATSSSSERSQVIPQQHSSPSPSLHSAQTSNDDESVPQVTATRVHNPPRLRHLNHSFNQLNNRLHQSGANGATGSDWRDSIVAASVASGSIMPDASLSKMGSVSSVVVGDADVPPPYSDTTESEDERYMGIGDEIITCPVPHEGREMFSMVLPISVDELFTLLFTNSSFFIDFIQNTRKYTDMQVGQWQEGENPAIKCRTVSFTIPLANNIGIKSTRAVETQTLLDASRPGEFYAINVDASNNGVPYADKFAVSCHWCISRCGHRQSRIAVHSQIKYIKSVWGIVKTFIEKNTWAALEENFSQLKHCLLQVAPSRATDDVLSERRSELPSVVGSVGTSVSPVVAGVVSSGSTKSRLSRPRRRRPGKDESVLMDKRLMGDSQALSRTSGSVKQSAVALPSPLFMSSASSSAQASNGSSVFYVVIISLLLLLCTNGFLFSKIWTLEQLAEQLARNPPNCNPTPNMADLRVLTVQPKSTEDWVKILRQQEAIYRATETKWRTTLTSMSNFLKQTQESLANLEKEIEPDTDLIRAILEKIQPQLMPTLHEPPPGSPPGEPPLASQSQTGSPAEPTRPG